MKKKFTIAVDENVTGILDKMCKKTNVPRGLMVELCIRRAGASIYKFLTEKKIDSEKEFDNLKDELEEKV